jgi:hypothetical protein
MKNNLLLNLLLALALSGAAATVLFGCNDAKRDNNSPDGKSYNSEINDGPGKHNDTDPQNTGGIMNEKGSGSTQDPNTAGKWQWNRRIG